MDNNNNNNNQIIYSNKISVRVENIYGFCFIFEKLNNKFPNEFNGLISVDDYVYIVDTVNLIILNVNKLKNYNFYALLSMFAIVGMMLGLNFVKSIPRSLYFSLFTLSIILLIITIIGASYYFEKKITKFVKDAMIELNDKYRPIGFRVKYIRTRRTTYVKVIYSVPAIIVQQQQTQPQMYFINNEQTPLLK